MAQKRTVTVEQWHDRREDHVEYHVRQTRNTTSPKIGDVLKEPDVQALIDDGVEVVIGPTKG